MSNLSPFLYDSFQSSMINRQWAHVWYSNRSKQHYFHRTTIHNRRFYMTQLIHLDGNSLTLEEVIAVARHGAQCELDEQAKSRYRIP